MRFVAPGIARAEHAWQKAHGRVDNNHRCELATRQDKIADRQLLSPSRKANALVDTLVSTAHQHEMRGAGQIVRHRLSEPAAGRREQDHARLWSADGLDGCDQWLDA